MNTTDTDIDIDIEDVHEIITSDLNGERIESLLYKAGLDSEHKLGDEGVSVLEIQGDSLTIIMSETWETDGLWYIDPKNIVLDIFEGDRFERTVFPDDIHSEEDLVEWVEDLFEQGVI